MSNATPIMTLQLTEYYRRSFTVVAPSGKTLEDMLHPEEWKHVASQLSAYDRIELRSADDDWLAELVVTKAERLKAHVSVLLKSDMGGKPKDKKQPKVPSGYTVSFKGPAHRWSVVSPTGALLHTGETSKEDATQWAIDDAATKTSKAG